MKMLDARGMVERRRLGATRTERMAVFAGLLQYWSRDGALRPVLNMLISIDIRSYIYIYSYIIHLLCPNKGL